MVEPDNKLLAEKIRICQHGNELEKQKAWDEIAEMLLPHLIRMAIHEQRLSWLDDHDFAIAEDVAMEAFYYAFYKGKRTYLARPYNGLGIRCGSS